MDLKKLDEMFKYAQYNDDEYSEFCMDLYQLARREGYGSKELFVIIEKEVDIILKHFQENTRIIEVEEERVLSKYKKLEWKGIDY